MIGAAAIGDAIARDCEKYLNRALDVLSRLDPDAYTAYLIGYYREGLKRFGRDWGYIDIVTALLGIAERLKPESYLEIGVRRGRSVCAVASVRPGIDIAMFDMWVANYAGMENPGEAHVHSELDRFGHKGKREFINGNSHMTLKQYFADHPEAYFDMITVDGDHSNLGAAEDIADVLPRLSIGGALVFDDTCNPNVAGLGAVWKRMVADNPRFAAYTYSDVGYGVGVAIRKY
jgi:predicted O-methyltransferase YrrM